MLSIDALKLLFDTAKELWNKTDAIKERSRGEAEAIAETCGTIADALEDKRNAFLDGTGFNPIHIPHYVEALARLLDGRLPNDQQSDYLGILRSAAEAVRTSEGMTPSQFSQLEPKQRDELIEPLNAAIGEFRALSKTLYL